MMIGINAGHTKRGAGSGAVGIISESEQTRVVAAALEKLLTGTGITVQDCTVDSADSQNAYLPKRYVWPTARIWTGSSVFILMQAVAEE